MRRTPLAAEPLAPALAAVFPPSARQVAPAGLASAELAPELALAELAPPKLASGPAIAESPLLFGSPPAARDPESSSELEHAQPNEHARTTANAPDEARLDRNISTTKSRLSHSPP